MAAAARFLKMSKSLILRPVFAVVGGAGSPAFTVIVGNWIPVEEVTAATSTALRAAVYWYVVGLISSSTVPPMVGTSRISLTWQENNLGCMEYGIIYRLEVEKHLIADLAIQASYVQN